VVGGAKVDVTKGAATEVGAGTLVVGAAVLGFTVLGTCGDVFGAVVVAMDVVAANDEVGGAVERSSVVPATDRGAVVPTALVAGAVAVVAPKLVEAAAVTESADEEGADVNAAPVVP